MTLLSILLSYESSIIIKCFFFLCKFQWIIILDFFVILCFETSSNISSNPFFKLALLMSCIVIFCKIMSPSMDCRHENVTYMLSSMDHQIN
jgi:hypothetical protein